MAVTTYGIGDAPCRAFIREATELAPLGVLQLGSSGAESPWHYLAQADIPRSRINGARCEAARCHADGNDPWPRLSVIIWATIDVRCGHRREGQAPMIARLSFALASVLAMTLRSGALPNIEGEELYMRCKEPNGEKWGYCTGFADGVAHFLNAEHAICLTSKQIRDVAVKFLQEHPELRSNDGYSLVGRALTEAFPCAEGPPNE
jgi:hypothetical protein